MPKVVKKLFNGANILLVVILSLTAFFVHNITKQTESEIIETTSEIRVLSTEKTNFGQLQYQIWYNGSVWEATSIKYLKLGYVYRAELQGKSYSFNSEKRFETFSLTYGILGKLKVKKIYPENFECDLLCQSINSLQNIRIYSQNKYFQSFCSEFKAVVNNFLSGRCKDMSVLAYGLVLGGNNDFSDRSKKGFKTLGLSHLVAVSGFQVILLINFIEFWLNKIPSRAFRWLANGLSLITFVSLVGPDPPVLRSSLSVLISSFALGFLGRKLSGLRALIYSALIMLWINPYYAYSLSFQLSFLASFGLMQTGKIMPEINIGWLSSIVENLLTSLMAYLFTLPIILNLNGSTSLLSVVLNTIIAPLVPIVTIFNIFGLIPVLGDFVLIFSGFWQLGFLLGVDFLSEFPTISIGKLGNLEIVGYYSVLCIGICLVSKVAKAKKLKTETVSIYN